MPKNKNPSTTKIKETSKQTLTLAKPDIVFIPNLDVDLIKPNPKNPTIMDGKLSDLLLKSIKIGGFLTVVTVWKPKDKKYFQFVDGEHRWRAVKAGGGKTIPALWAKHITSQAQADYFLLMLNRTKGHFNQFKLGFLLTDLDKNLKNISELTGYELASLEALTHYISMPKVAEAEVQKFLEKLSPEVKAVADKETISPIHPQYEEKPKVFFMVSLKVEDYAKINEIIEKIQIKEGGQDLATILLKVFEAYDKQL